MSKPKSTRPVHGQVRATSSTYLTALTGQLVLAYGGTNLRVVGFQRNVRGNHALKPRYCKVAVRQESPENASFTDGTAVTNDTPFSEDFSLASLGAFMFVRPMLANAVTAGSAGEALAWFEAFTDSPAELVADQIVPLGPTVNSSQSQIVPVGKLFPAQGVTGVMLAIEARGVSGSPTMNVITRTLTGDPSWPAAWDTTGLLGTAKTFSSTNEDYNTGDLSWTPTGVGWGQIGLLLPAANANGELRVIAAVKY